ncbi:MAG: hypothetical protein IT531_02905 [Burkholderiales bacterium]|nr:hypothetical protein [Burkholderiales bacterium]
MSEPSEPALSAAAARSIPRLEIELRASYILAGLLAAAHCAAFAVAVAGLQRLELIGAAALALLGQACWSIRRHALLHAPRAIVHLDCRGEDRCIAWRRDGTRVQYRIRASSYVTRYLTVLHLRRPGERRSCHVVLLPDSMPADLMRRLRVRLRWMRFDAAGAVEERTSL